MIAIELQDGFEDGTYLIPHTSERNDKYTRRKNMSYYVNYVKPVIDAHVNPIFNTEPARQGMSPTFNRFINDVDGNNTSITRFMKKVAIMAKLHGVQFVVVDMAKIDDSQVITEADIEQERIYPYLYSVSPSQVINWATDKFGRLISISYVVRNSIIDETDTAKDIEETWTWTETKCKKVVDGNEEVFDNNIGVIPVVPIYGVINATDDLIPQSDLYGIARTSLAMFNACSELRELHRNQAFSILTYPIGDDDDYENGDEPIRIGTADLLLYRGSSSAAPEFITPPSDSSDVLMDEIQLMIREIYRQANMQFATQEQVSNVSGLAKAYDNQQLYQTISELADGLQRAEKKIATIFSLYMDEPMDDYSVSYNKEYGVTDTTEVLTNATTALSMDICEGLNYETKRKVIRAMLVGTDSKVIDEVLNNLDKDPDKVNPINQSDTQSTSSVKVVQPVAK